MIWNLLIALLRLGTASPTQILSSFLFFLQLFCRRCYTEFDDTDERRVHLHSSGSCFVSDYVIKSIIKKLCCGLTKEKPEESESESDRPRDRKGPLKHRKDATATKPSRDHRRRDTSEDSASRCVKRRSRDSGRGDDRQLIDQHGDGVERKERGEMRQRKASKERRNDISKRHRRDDRKDSDHRSTAAKSHRNGSSGRKRAKGQSDDSSDAELDRRTEKRHDQRRKESRDHKTGAGSNRRSSSSDHSDEDRNKKKQKKKNKKKIRRRSRSSSSGSGSGDRTKRRERKKQPGQTRSKAPVVIELSDSSDDGIGSSRSPEVIVIDDGQRASAGPDESSPAGFPYLFSGIGIPAPPPWWLRNSFPQSPRTASQPLPSAYPMGPVPGFSPGGLLALASNFARLQPGSNFNQVLFLQPVKNLFFKHSNIILRSARISVHVW